MFEFGRNIASYKFQGNLHDFAAAIELIIVRPQLIDKRLSGAIIVKKVETADIDKKDIFETFVKLPKVPANEEIIEKSPFQGYIMIKRKLIMKKNAENFNDIVIWSFHPDSAQVVIIPENSRPEGYAWRAFANGDLELWAAEKAPQVWLQNQASKKILSWCQDKLGDQALVGSLRQVSIEEYTMLYNKLKDRHFSSIFQAWHSESTNADKFIHEDLGIAAYLLLIWKHRRPNSFVDLGCGNGLLVYILTKEGIPGGVGLDIRKRKIWNFFRENGADLRVQTVEAKADDTFKGYDWLIGNHSDELTPWIPVMAKMAKSNYFLLPCCAFDFFGKFQRTTTDKSQYRDYLDHILNIGKNCGFSVAEDKLRIPSTKRTCFVGIFNGSESCINDFIENLVQNAAQFVPRVPEEQVKNCTKVPKSVTNSIINLIVESLLKLTESEVLAESWNPGGQLHLAEISSSILNSELLKELKSECGGLQTLLRNFNNIFIVDKGLVRLRNPSKDSVSMGKKRPSSDPDKYRKTRPCWFFQHHPQGCPANDEVCFWMH